jgi:hydroxypyruvate isomerase
VPSKRREQPGMSYEPRYAVNCSILFTELPLLERPAAAKAAGFDAVEFWWPFSQIVPNAHQVDEFVTAIDQAGVHLVALNFAAGDPANGDRGILSLPGRGPEFSDNVDVVVSIGRRLGTKAFNAPYGNRLDDVEAAEQDELALENLALAARKVGEIDAVVLLEPLSGAPRYPLLRAADVAQVIERVKHFTGIENIQLLADLYHLTVNGDDIPAVISGYGEQIRHVQIADAPGRHEPGTGTVDFHKYFRELASIGYEGWISLEYSPSTSTDRSFAWLAGGSTGELAYQFFGPHDGKRHAGQGRVTRS